MILALILAPIAESVVFQGWFYEAGYFLFNRNYAIALSIGGFLLVHGTVSWYLLAAALALIALRLRTHSLGPLEGNDSLTLRLDSGFDTFVTLHIRSRADGLMQIIDVTR